MTAAVCPYCRCPLDAAAGEQLECPGCGTPHHQDCYSENGGCTVFGCSAAPADEAKMSVSAQEVATAVAAVATETGPTYVLFGESAAAGAGALPPVAPASGTTAIAPPPPPPMGGTGTPPPPRVGQMQAAAVPLTPAELYNDVAKPHDRMTFILLGVFLGCFGAHNFYAGYHKKAAFQLVLTVLTCFYGSVISWIWAVVEVCTIRKDSDGVQFS
jgi:TM2 domain-containing membrane protein YozV